MDDDKQMWEIWGNGCKTSYAYGTADEAKRFREATGASVETPTCSPEVVHMTILFGIAPLIDMRYIPPMRQTKKGERVDWKLAVCITGKM